MVGTSFLVILLLCMVGYFLARRRAGAWANQDAAGLHSLPSYHGYLVALWVGIPSFLLVIFWVFFQDTVIDGLLIASLPVRVTDGLSESEIQLLVSQIHSISAGQVFGEPPQELIAAAERLSSWQELSRWAMFASGAAFACIGLAFTYRKLSPEFRARQGVEITMAGLMIFCSVVAILTTLGIVLSLLFEAFRFFDRVPITEFLFGLNWEPQISIREDQVAGAGAFGAVPVFLGTILIASIAMLVATPIGLFSAIYLAEYSNSKFRAAAKPLLELLAGVPTVVYGFFAVLTVAPAMREFGAMIGIDVAPNSALAAGSVMGIMIIPFISSLSDDALGAVPQSLREGSYGLGATKAETIKNVLLPAALPGIVGGLLLAVSRAIGETMIVVMAAGLIANMTLNPLDSTTTVTVQIVTLLIGDSEFDNPKTLAAFALGLVLFLATLVLNVIALRTVKKYREKYD